mmetsp:Transcript_74682/g.211271  ORF Transcript_74682/g.211271 Transcript_74682/m.211271 type:complete len:309 (-) Transcript_74682:31-957(-)
MSQGPGEEVPESFGWPKEPYVREALAFYVDEFCKRADAESSEMSAGVQVMKLDYVAGADPNSYKAGEWYNVMNHRGDCVLYVHNYTRDITAVRPPNFKGITEEERRVIARLGTFIQDLSSELDKVYRVQKALPLVMASEETCDALRNFAVWDAKSTLLDATKLRRVNPAVLEESRKSIVYAMKEGTTLWVWLGDNDMPFFETKICTSKNRDKVPLGLFMHGGLESDVVKDKIYTEDDKSDGACKVKPDFKVVFLAMYDNFMHEMSGIQLAALQERVPYFEYLQKVKCYSEGDKLKLLAKMRGDELAKG